MKKTTRLKNNTQGSGRSRIARSLSAAVIASAMMSGAAVAQTFVFNAGGSPYTVGNEQFNGIRVEGNAVVNGSLLTSSIDINAAHAVGTASGRTTIYAGTINGIELTGPGGLLKWSAGTGILTNAHSYAGATAIEDGVLSLTQGGAINGTSGISIINAATLAIANNVDINHVASLDLGLGGNLVVDAADTITTTYSGNISGGAASDIVKNGLGALVVSGDNAAFDGTATVNNGTLEVQSNLGTAGVFVGVDGELNVNLGANILGNAFNNNVLSDGVVSIDTSDDTVTTLGGVIDGLGSVEVDGTGTAVLTGANTYAGGTTVYGGTLEVGNGVALGSTAGTGLVDVRTGGRLLVDLANNEVFANNVTVEVGGALISDSANTNTLTGVIDNDGVFAKNGTGRTIVDNALTSLGTTGGAIFVNDGILEVAHNGNLGFNTWVDVDAPGVLDTTGTSVHGFGASTIQSVGALTGNGTVNIGGGELTVGTNDWDASFSGLILGNVVANTGTVIKEGAGDWTLTATDWITNDVAELNAGDLIINNGAVVVEGRVNADVTVNDLVPFDGIYGELLGNGIINGNVVNHGVVNPGTRFDIGQLNINGSYTQGVDGELGIYVHSRTRHDKLVVDGTADLAGSLNVIGYNIRNFRPGQKVTVLSATNGVFGTFDNVYGLWSNTMLHFGTYYTPNNVELRVRQRSFAKLKGLTHNQRQVAHALDAAAKRYQIRDTFDHLNYTRIKNVPALLSLLSPEDLTAIFNIGFATSQIQNVNLERRLDDVRAGSYGFSADGFAINNRTGTINYDGAPVANTKDGLTLAGWDGKSIVSKDVVAPVIEQSRWGFFITGSGEWADIETTSEARGQQFRSAGFTLGADYRVSENFVVGINGGYTNTHSDINRDGSIEVDGGRGGVYATVYGGGAYLNAAVGGGYNSYRTKRTTLGGTAHGDTDGAEFNGLLSGGYDYRVGGFSIGPVASLQYTYIGLGSFNETGSAGNLHFNDQHQESLRTTVGLKASYAWNAGGVVIRPEVRAQWKHEYLDSTADITSRFAGANRFFTVNGPDIGRDSLLLDAGASVEINPAVSVYAYYTGELGRTNYDSHSVNGGFRVAF